MDIRCLKNFEQFNSEKMAKHSLFSTEQLFFDLYCLLPGQEQRIHAHEGSDKVYLAMRGKATLQIGEEIRILEPGEAVLAPAGVPHGVRNNSAEEAVLLVTMAPPPHGK